MRFKLSSDVKKYIDSQDKNTVKRIYKHLRDATKVPPEGDIIPLSDNSGRYRMRVGDFRFLFTIFGNVMLVVKISPRGDAYKK
jgi:mRNA-degrading endonuclease RelE of RelBE toxin-antitoxin system